MKKINKNNVFVMRNFDGVYTSGCDSPFTDRRGRERGGGVRIILTSHVPRKLQHDDAQITINKKSMK